MARIDATAAEVASNTELDSVTTGTAGSFTSSALQSRSGKRAWRATRTGAAANEQDFGQITIGSAPNLVTIRLSLYRPRSVLEINRSFVRLNFGALESVTLYNAGGASGWAVDITNGTGTDTLTSGVAVTQNSWQNIEIRVNRAATSTVVLRAESTTVSRTTTRLSAGIANMQFGLTSNATNDDEIFVDDIIIDAGGSTLTAIDDNRYLHFLPPNNRTGIGAGNDQWVNSGGAASKEAAVTDISDATSIRASGGSSASQLFNARSNLGTPVFPGATQANVVYLSARTNGSATGRTYQLAAQKSGDASANISGNLSAALSPTVTTQRSAYISPGRLSTGTTPWDGPSLQNDNFQLGPFYPSGQAATAQVDIYELWAYAEVTASAIPTDTATLTDAVPTKWLKARRGLTDARTLVDTLSSVKGRFDLGPILRSLTDDLPISWLKAKFGLLNTETLSDGVPAVKARPVVNEPLTLGESSLTRSRFSLGPILRTLTDALTNPWLKARFGLSATRTLSEQTPAVRAKVPLIDARVLTETTLFRTRFALTATRTLIEAWTFKVRFSLFYAGTLLTDLLQSIEKFFKTASKKILMIFDE